MWKISGFGQDVEPSGVGGCLYFVDAHYFLVIIQVWKRLRPARAGKRDSSPGRMDRRRLVAGNQ
jgi:hypothetical protein